MLLWIILGSIVCIVAIIILLATTVCSTIWRIIPVTQYICAVFDEVFWMYLTEGVFSRDQPEEITIGKVKVKFSNLEEACNEVERYVNKNLKDYDKHTWFNISPEWEENHDKLIEIQSKIRWLRKNSNGKKSMENYALSLFVL